MVIQESHPGPYNDKGEKCFEFTLLGLGGIEGRQAGWEWPAQARLEPSFYSRGHVGPVLRTLGVSVPLTAKPRVHAQVHLCEAPGTPDQSDCPGSLCPGCLGALAVP